MSFLVYLVLQGQNVRLNFHIVVANLKPLCENHTHTKSYIIKNLSKSSCIFNIKPWMLFHFLHNQKEYDYFIIPFVLRKSNFTLIL